MKDNIVVVIINGEPRSGKNTFVRLMKNIYPYRVSEVSSVNKVKQAAFLLGWNGLKDSKGRKFLSDLKDMSTELYNGPLTFMVEEVQKAPINSLIFLHIREPEEIDKLKEVVNDLVSECCITLLVKRGVKDKFDNHADRDVEKYEYDYIVDNGGDLEDLKKEVECFNSILKVKRHV